MMNFYLGTFNAVKLQQDRVVFVKQEVIAAITTLESFPHQ